MKSSIKKMDKELKNRILEIMTAALALANKEDPTKFFNALRKTLKKHSGSKEKNKSNNLDE